MSVHFWSRAFKTLLELNLHGWWTWFTMNFYCLDRPEALSAEDWKFYYWAEENGHFGLKQTYANKHYQI